MRDADVRAEVRRMLAREYANDPEARIVEEMGVWSGSVRIDLAVINSELNGYELKSDRDTLERLPLQAELYSRVFDYLVLVVGKRHVKKASTLVPEWWGVTIAVEKEGGISLERERIPKRNPSPDPYLVAQLLWKEEALEVLECHDLAKGFYGKRIKEIHERLATELDFDVLAAEVRVFLKQRSAWLRKTIPCQLDMSVNTNLNPRL